MQVHVTIVGGLGQWLFIYCIDLQLQQQDANLQILQNGKLCKITYNEQHQRPWAASKNVTSRIVILSRTKINK